jgi:hypothetical protein
MVLPTDDLTLNSQVEVVEEASLPTKTYLLDIKNGRCIGKVDGIRALEQAIFKMLSTTRFNHVIYSDDYGLESLIGKEKMFIQAELPRQISETLLQDDRITNVEDMKINLVGDSASVSFTCLTVYGELEVLKEVDVFV